jgi:hypothetical protein
MSTVEEIQAAIQSLEHDQYMLLLDWIREQDSQNWDDQIDRDNEAGRLDFLFAQADEPERAGTLREWPAPE